MPKACCVLNCGESSRSSRNLSYHQVPSAKNDNGATLQFWLKRIRRRDFIYNPVKYIYVCSKHFKASDFQENLANGHKRLKENAVPSQFNWDFSTNVPNETNILDPQEEIVKNVLNELIDIVERNSSEDLLPLAEVGDNEGSKVYNKDKKLEEEIIALRKEIAELKLQVAVQKELISVRDFQIRQAKLQLDKETREREIVEQRLKNMKPNIESLKDNDEDIQFYTGLPSYNKLMALYALLNPGENGENIKFWRKGKNNDGNSPDKISPSGRPRKLDVKEQFLLVLMRMRLGLFVKDLAHRFGISPSTVSNICNTWINLMYFRLGHINIWPTREKIDETMPSEFKELYPTTRVILDASEIKVETPTSLVMQSATYSNYKSCNTFKGLIGISPNGYVTFVSHLFTGSISDKEITRRSGFLSLDFENGDSVMADKGFLIEDMLKEINVDLNIPPFLRDDTQFSEKDLEETQKIAALRIHVERRIARIRGYHIFDRPIPLCLAPVLNQLWTVTAILTNFQTPIMKCNVTDNNILEKTIQWDDEVTATDELEHTAQWDEELNATFNSSFQEEIIEPEGATLDSSFEDAYSETSENISVVDLNTSFED